MRKQQVQLPSLLSSVYTLSLFSLEQFEIALKDTTDKEVNV
jgi:hypothetical protein